MGTAITSSVLAQAMDYHTFKDEVQRLYEEGKPTSGEAGDAALLEFTKLNLNRLKRNEKTNKVDPELASQLANFPKSMYWLVLAEGWCGDVAESVPVLYNIAEPHAHVKLRLIFRDQNPEVMDQYLTNGAKAIPKLVMLDEQQLQILGVWGPRPEPLQAFVEEKKQERDQFSTKMEWVNNMHEGLHKWYAKDKGQTLQQELQQVLKAAQEQVKAF